MFRLRFFHLFSFFLFYFWFWLKNLLCFMVCFSSFFRNILNKIVVLNLSFDNKISWTMSILKHHVQKLNILCDIIAYLFKFLFFFDINFNYLFLLVINNVETDIFLLKLLSICFIQNFLLFCIKISKS